jgi:hypothetical protein
MTRKILLGGCLFTATLLNAATTTCSKINWEKPSSIEMVKLDGGECKGEFSLKQMKAKGWYIEDIKIKKNKTGLDYTYTLTTQNPVKISQQAMAKNIQDKKAIEFNASNIVLTNTNNSTATIPMGNLKVGQSGIVLHKYENGKKLIVSSAYVTQSNTTQSTLKFIPFLGLKQNAIPTSSRKPQNGDQFILNYLYEESLLIAPNAEAFRAVRKKFKDNNFPHSDLFGSYLKSNYEPTPNKREIQEYALSQDLRTIFVVIESYVYIVDTRTLAILGKKPVSYLRSGEQMPFYTRIDKIESSIFKGDWKEWLSFKYVKKIFGDDERSEDEILYGDLADDKNKTTNENYTAYYKKLLGV